ncbi:MAG: peroxidase family protein [Gaiellaceae bacterium]
MGFARLLIPVASFLDRRIGWDRLPPPLGIVTLIGLREQLRKLNLADTGLVKEPPPKPADLKARTLDGGWNDVSLPSMGSINARFGRNVPLDRAYPETDPDFLEPSPRLVSRRLLARERFIPAESINLLAAAWIQFEVHDWMSHDTDPAKPISLELDEDDDWPERPMAIPSSVADSGPAANGTPPLYSTRDTHWWDGSQIYGHDEAFQKLARASEGGKLVIDSDGLHPEALDELLDPVGPRGNFWVGLAVLHALFIREHNAICDALRRGHPDWSDQQLYDKARLVNAAVMAKIHTVEWTPAIIAHPTTERGMHANWYGLLGERIRRKLGRLGRNDVFSGIPGSPTDHHGAPYSLTEEFVSVYRMHPLIPDDYEFRSLDGAPPSRTDFAAIGPRRWREPLEKMGVAEAFYSFGVAHPGAIVLHNYPCSLIKDFRPDKDGPPVDLATVDILRDRERGVPRYNEFRVLMHRKPAASFEELARDARVAAELQDVYGHVDRVDLMVGLYAEPRPHGFAFCDTAFRVFLLMASRRLKSDRFLTADYTPETYTQTGLDWIDNATMSKVLLRHHPELAAVIRHDNAFKPWQGARA